MSRRLMLSTLCGVCAPARKSVASVVVAAAVRSLSTIKVAHPVYKEGPTRSNAQKLINKIPVIEVNAHVAVCDGGSGALGHPIEYIQLDTVSNEPQVCKYCGLRFKMGHVHHH